MAENQLLSEVQKLSFKSISWIYLKKGGDYENQISAARDELIWIPSKGSAAIAKKTKFGDGVDRNRVIMVSLDKQLFQSAYLVQAILSRTSLVQLSAWLV